MATLADPVAFPARPLGAALAAALAAVLRRLGGPRPRRVPTPRLSDHLLRDLGLTRADVEGL